MPELPGVPPLETPFRDVYTVSRLNREARNALETGFPLIWVEGEISNLARPASGGTTATARERGSGGGATLWPSGGGSTRDVKGNDVLP